MKEKKYNSETESVLKKLEDDNLNNWEKKHKITEDLVWHYTDQKGLIAILKYGTIRLSNALYLNDSMEINQAKSVICDSIQKNLLTKINSDLSEFFKQIKVSLQVSNLVSQPLVGCFSGEKAEDLLSQWQAYGNDGQGYALGFESDKLNICSKDIKVRKIIYDENEQTKIVNKLIKEYKEELSKIPKTSTAKKQSFIRDFSHSFAKIIHEFLYCFKHQSWEAEHEIRLIYNTIPYLTEKPLPNPSNIEFRESQSGYVIPYKDIDIRIEDPNDFKKRLPLKKIIIGPKINFTLAEQSLEQMLEKYNYSTYPGDSHSVSIQRSKLTLR